MFRYTSTIIGSFAFAFAISAQANLITNGDFESGASGFTSGYVLSPGNITPAGTYDVVTNPALVHPNATSYGDHTSGSGNMLAVNGASIPGVIVWGETVVVDPSTNYDFAAYLSSWTSISPADLLFSVNGLSIGSLAATSTTGVWNLFFTTWNSGTSTSANIQIVNANTASSGNDFALDDIYFGNPIFSVPEPATFALMSLGLAGMCFGKRLKLT